MGQGALALIVQRCMTDICGSIQMEYNKGNIKNLNITFTEN